MMLQCEFQGTISSVDTTHVQRFSSMTTKIDAIIIHDHTGYHGYDA